MAEFLFRAEAVNLNATIYDTSDISSIRGGGFYLLNRIEMFSEESKYKKSVITQGASMVVLKIDTDKPGELRQKILKYLYSKDDENKLIKEMMFLVEYVKSGGNVPKEMATLMGRIRYAQMRSPKMRIFSETLEPGVDQKTGKHFTFDSLNRVLPAHKISKKKDEEKSISNFTAIRHDQGGSLRQKIYFKLLRDELPDKFPYNFTDNLNDLSHYDVNSGKLGNLNDKIAFFYIDGNKFGAFQKEFGKKKLMEFDGVLQEFKKKFLAKTIKLEALHKSFWNEGKLRLETILWGGDEIKLIVPACMGWKVASLFFDTVEEFYQKEEGKGLKFDGKDLTYAMSLVFSHHKNPIKNLNNTSEKLAQAVKDKIKDAENIKDCKKPEYSKKYGNRMHYMVMESLEALPDDYESFAAEYYKTESQKLSLSPSGMKDLQRFAKNLKRLMARSQIASIAAAWASGKKGEYTTVLQRALDVCEKARRIELAKIIKEATGTEFKDDFKAQEEPKPEKGFVWLQIFELWDYLTWEEK